jgi:hypothetical protein
MPRVFRSWVNRMRSPNYQRIALAQGLQTRLKLGADGVLAAGVLLVNLPALRLLQSIALKIERLVISRDPRIADLHIPFPYVANLKSGTVCEA